LNGRPKNKRDARLRGIKAGPSEANMRPRAKKTWEQTLGTFSDYKDGKKTFQTGRGTESPPGNGNGTIVG